MALPWFLVTNAAKTALESQSGSKRLFAWRLTRAKMNEVSGSYMTYTFFPYSSLTWQQAHSKWVSYHGAAWNPASRPSYPVFQRNACRVVSYYNDPTATSYIASYQQSVRMFLGNIISIRLALPPEFVQYREYVTGFEIVLLGGAVVSTTTFNASVNDYVFASNRVEPQTPLATRMTVTASRPSKPENVLQSTSFQTSIYTLQQSSLGQASSILEGWVVPPGSGGYVFQNMTVFPYGSTAITINPPSSVNTAFANLVKASPSGECWLSVAITEDFVYPIPMRTNLLAYLGEFEVYAKF